MADMTELAKQVAPAVRTAAPVDVTPGALATPPPPTPAPKLPAQNVLSGGSVDARTKALLEAVATGGKRGLESYQQSEKAIGEYRKQALGRASSLAAIVGGPESQGFEQIADQQYGARLTDLDQSRTAFTEDMARTGLAGRTAVDAFGKIQPLIRAQVSKAIEKKRAETVSAAKEQVAKDWEARALGQAEIDEQTASKNLETLDKDITRLETERAELEKPIKERSGRIGAIDKEIVKLKKDAVELAKAPALEGVGPRKTTKEIYAKIDQLAKERHALIRDNQTKLSEWDKRNAQSLTERKAERDKFAGVTAETRGERARRIAEEQLGIDPSLATGKITAKDAPTVAPDDKTIMSKAGIKDAKELGSLRSSEGYQKVQSNLQAWVQGGTTKEQFLAAMRSDPMFNVDGKFNVKLYNLIITEVANLFPTSASLRSLDRGTEAS